jgi:hypothetical protein
MISSVPLKQDDDLKYLLTLKIILVKSSISCGATFGKRPSGALR